MYPLLSRVLRRGVRGVDQGAGRHIGDVMSTMNTQFGWERGVEQQPFEVLKDFTAKYEANHLTSVAGDNEYAGRGPNITGSKESEKEHESQFPSVDELRKNSGKFLKKVQQEVLP